MDHMPVWDSPSRCTLAKATDQHHERVPLRGSFRGAFGPQGEVLLDGLVWDGRSRPPSRPTVNSDMLPFYKLGLLYL